MNINQIEMQHFMSHTATKVDLPARGLVLVTGPNGAGKSSLAEAVAMACWGKLLRGASPWTDGQAGFARANTDLVLAMRGKTGARTLLVWSPTDEAARAAMRLNEQDPDNPTFENNTKAQEAMERVIQTFDVWKRTHVFSSADAAHFTLSTDGERKRLLEAILGIERFDAALDACRTDTKGATAAYNDAERAYAVARARREGAERTFEEAQRTLADLPDCTSPAALEQKVAELEQRVRTYRGDMQGLQDRSRSADRGAMQAEAEAVQREQAFQRVNRAQCGACGQAIAEHLRAKAAEEASAAKKEAERARKAAMKKARELESDLDELHAECDAVQEQRNKLAAKVAEAKQISKQRREAEAALERARAELADRGNEVAELERRMGAAVQECSVLEAVERVLGLKGVRAHILGRALGGIEQAANAWLARIGPRIHLRLKSYSEKKTGGVSDYISLEICNTDVQGTATWRPYAAHSGGERRRIDVALLLALSDVARAAYGREPGTIFMDEVFDALDEDGTEAVVSVVNDLAADRAVVLITHSEALARRLTPVVHLHVEGGTIT